MYIHICSCTYAHIGASQVKHPPVCIGDTRDVGSVPGLRRSSGEGLVTHSLQHSCLESPMDRGAGQAIVHRVTKESDMTEHTHTHTRIHIYVCTCVWCLHTYTFSLDCVRVTAGWAKSGRRARGAGLLLSSSLRSSSYSILPRHSI